MTKILIYGIGGVVAVLLVAFFVGSNLGGESRSTGIAVPPTTQSGGALEIPLVPPGGNGTAPKENPVFGLSFKDYSGNAVNISDFRGKPLVLNAWAAWCPFCRQELPDFVQAQKEFGDKVVIIAINRQESIKTAKGYTDSQGTSNGLVFLLDPGDSFYRAIGGFSMPETIFVGKNGEIVIHKRGPMDIQEIRDKIQRIIAP